MTDITEIPSTEFLESMLVDEVSRPDKGHIRHALGVIAVDDGSKQGTYAEAMPVDECVPAPLRYSVPIETELYRRLSTNSPAAIDMRQKAAARMALLERTMNVVLGEN